MLPRVGRTICHAISVSLSPSETGAPKGVAMSRCPLDSGVRSIMAGCSGHDGNHEHGVLFRNEIKTQLFPERRLPRAGTAQTGPAPTIAEGGPFRVHARLAPLSAAEQFGAWGGGVVAGRGAKFPRFPAVPASSPCSQHDFVSLLCVEISGTASSLSRAMFHHRHQPSPRLAVCIVDVSTPLSISAHGFGNK